MLYASQGCLDSQSWNAGMLMCGSMSTAQIQNRAAYHSYIVLSMYWLRMQNWMMLWGHLSESFRMHQPSCVKGLGRLGQWVTTGR